MASHRESDGDEQELLDLRISEDVENNAMAYMFEPRAARCFFLLLNIFIQDQSMAPPARVRLLPVSQED